MGERGVVVDHSTLNRWVITYAPEVKKQFRRHQRPVGRSWRVDGTYVTIKGEWAYIYRAVDTEGHTIDVLLSPTRDQEAAEAFLCTVIGTQGLPEKITIGKSGANTAATTRDNKTQKTTIVIHHSKYLNKWGIPLTHVRRQMPASRLRTTCITCRSATAGTIKPTKSCRAFTTSPHCSCGGCLERSRVAFNNSILHTISMNSCFALTAVGQSPADCFLPLDQAGYCS